MLALARAVQSQRPRLVVAARGMSVVSKDALKAAMSSGAVVVDLRSEAERAAGPVAARALHLEWDKAAGGMRLEGLPEDKSKPIVLH
mmetsp:Transcript_78323/g.241703  ORF Transcript_78323/g.241703 Transcript_78323/m.241703 type:complete len:87 (-) Transcript_78323:183-443(-)